MLDYRKKYLDLLLRGGEEEAKQAEADYERARTQADKDYEETAAAVADKAPLMPDEEAELNRLWKSNGRKERRERRERNRDWPCFVFFAFFVANSDFAEDPHGFILRQGWASLDCTDEIADKLDHNWLNRETYNLNDGSVVDW